MPCFIGLHKGGSVVRGLWNAASHMQQCFLNILVQIFFRDICVLRKSMSVLWEITYFRLVNKTLEGEREREKESTERMIHQEQLRIQFARYRVVYWNWAINILQDDSFCEAGTMVPSLKLPSDNGIKPETLILEPDMSRKIWGSILSLCAVTDNLSESSCLFVPEAVGAIYVRDSYRKRNCWFCFHTEDVWVLVCLERKRDSDSQCLE